MFMIAFALVLVAVDANDLCTKIYADAIPAHTACFEDSPNLISSGVTATEQQDIVDLHNDLRRSVVVDAGVPTDLLELVWDDKVAAIAEKLAKQCTDGHDKNRNVLEYSGSVGQNMGSGYISWKDVINGWYKEKQYFKYGVKVNETTGHFTQVVNSRASRIGCGFASCSTGYKRYWVCNYYQGQYNYIKPFTPGTERCSACSANCVDGLCSKDCVGKMCKNGGSLDLSTCGCTCKEPYVGDLCEKMNCPTTEHINCGSLYWPKACTYSNVKRDCPLMCGPCPAEIVKYNSTQGCLYHGVRKTAEQCTELGDDGWYCESKGGSWGCTACQTYSNVPKSCPKTCGLCK